MTSDLAARLQVAGRTDRALEAECAIALGLPASAAVFEDTVAVWSRKRELAPAAPWSAGVGPKGAFGQVGEHRATSKAGPGAALAAALLLFLGQANG